MDKDIKKFIVGICGGLTSITVCFFFLVYFIFFEQKNTSAFKDAMDLSISFFSALATLGAAIIAAKLFENWKDTQSNINRSELAKNIQMLLLKLNNLCDKNFHDVMNFTEINELICNPDSNAPLSPGFIARQESIRLTLNEKNTNFKDEYNKIIELFNNYIEMYQTNYEDLQLNAASMFEFDGYQMAISSLLMQHFSNESIQSISFFKAHLESRKKHFEDTFLNPILNKTSPFINFNKN